MFFFNSDYRQLLLLVSMASVALAASLSLWIAHGQAKWQWRTAALLLLNGGLLRIVAPDLAIYFSAQTLTCWTIAKGFGVAAKLWTGGWRRPQFSLATLLAAWVAVSIGAAELGVIVNTPQRARLEWLLVGVIAGGLSSALFWASSRTRYGRRLIVIVPLVIWAAHATVDYALDANVLDHLAPKPVPAVAAFLPKLDARQEAFAYGAAAIVVLNILLLRWAGWSGVVFTQPAAASVRTAWRPIAWFSSECRRLLPSLARWRQTIIRRAWPIASWPWLWRAVWTSAFFLLLTPLARVWLHWPADIPPPPAPVRANPMSEIDALVPTVNWNSIPQQDYDEANEQALASFAEDNLELPGRLRPLLELNPYAQVEYGYGADLSANFISGRRDLARALAALSRAATLRGEQREAAHCLLDMLRLGLSAAREGLIVDLLTGSAIAEMGLFQFDRFKGKLTTELAQEVSELLLALDQQWPESAKSRTRDQAWDQQACRWQAKMDVAASAAQGIKERYVEDAIGRMRAMMRMLAIELTIGRYQADRGEPPAALADLAPQYLSSMPIDPFSGAPFVYRRTEEGYRLYSVGADGVDDGGFFDPSTYSQEDIPADFYAIREAHWRRQEAEQAAEVAAAQAEAAAMESGDPSDEQLPTEAESR